MKSILLAGAMFAVVFGCYFLFLRTKEHVVPENFPILTPAESKSDKPELFPILPAANSMNDATMASGSQLATFGSGCFWCTEAYFLQMKGVQKVVSGYCGGTVANPTYEQICTGNTGHAEVIQVTYDPNVVTYGDLLELFWRSHDPTTKNRQGADEGTQYRSVVFYHTDEQRQLAERYKIKIDEAKVYPAPLVTEIAPLATFYPAEGYHQNYYALNPKQGYCRSVIGPKLEKLKKVFADKFDAKR